MSSLQNPTFNLACKGKVVLYSNILLCADWVLFEMQQLKNLFTLPKNNIQISIALTKIRGKLLKEIKPKVWHLCHSFLYGIEFYLSLNFCLKKYDRIISFHNRTFRVIGTCVTFLFSVAFRLS